MVMDKVRDIVSTGVSIP